MHAPYETMIQLLLDWANSMPSVSAHTVFHRIARLMREDHFGIEHCTIDNWDDMDICDGAPEIEYLNTGRSYGTTLILTDDYVNGRKLLVSSWGDWLEQNEHFHMEESQTIRCGYCGHFTPFNYGEDDHNQHFCEHCNYNVSGGN